MEHPGKWMGLAVATVAVLAGSALLMGNLQSATQVARDAELGRVRGLARVWEARLESTRSLFREQVLRADLLPVIEHPEEWPSWRMETRLLGFQQAWPEEAGALRGLLLVNADVTLHSVLGDTTGASAALHYFARYENTDILLSGGDENAGACLALTCRKHSTMTEQASGWFVALLDPASVLTVDMAPDQWALLSDPQHALIASHRNSVAALINKSTWPLLISQESGSLPQGRHAVLTFSKVHVPGLPPLLLVSSLSLAGAATGWMLIGAGIMLLLCVSGWAAKLRTTQKSVPAALPERVHTDPQVIAPLVQASALEAELTPDAHSPFPVLRITPEGMIQFYNSAALKACPRLRDTPLLSDVLPSLEPQELRKLLARSAACGFESLLGSVPYRFEIVPVEDENLLYAHPLSTSQSLEVALQQAHENFNTMCAVCPYPILTVDPRNHVILEVNAVAAQFFGSAPSLLVGRILDSLASGPVDLTASRSRFEVDTADGHKVCGMRCEMLKIEGVPTILVSLEPERLLNVQPVSEERDKPEQFTDDVDETPEIRELSVGSPILVSFSPVVREVARRLLEKVGHSPEVFSNLSAATDWLISQNSRPEFLVVDISEFGQASDWVAEVRRQCGDVPCVAITDGVTDGPTSGSNAMLVKPFDLESLASALDALGLRVEAGLML